MSDDVLGELKRAVEQQIESRETPYVKATFERLRGLGLEESEVKEQIALCLGQEMERAFTTGKAFDVDVYRELLDQLPVPLEDAEESPFASL